MDTKVTLSFNEFSFSELEVLNSQGFFKKYMAKLS